MEIPSLPTDNLYKFVALSGVVLVVVGIALMYKNINLVTASSKEIAVLAEVLDTDIYEYKSQGDLYEKIATDSSRTTEEVSQIKNNTEEKKSNILKYSGLISALKIQQEITHLSYIYTAIISVLSYIVGNLLIFVGFKLWYHKVQIYEDIILKDKAEKLLNKKKISLKK